MRCCFIRVARIIGMFFFSSRRRHTSSTRDWSSDVCSSDLYPIARPTHTISNATCHNLERGTHQVVAAILQKILAGGPQIGRASCRERVEISEVAVALTRDNTRTEVLVP